MPELTKIFYTGSSKGVSAQITVTSAMDVQTNTSLVSVAVDLKSTSYIGTYYLNGTVLGDTGKTLATMNSSAGTHNVTFSAKNTYYAIRGSGGAKGSPWTYTATHDSDGSKTITVSVSISGYNSAGNGANGFSISGSYTVVLPQIPRASTVGATDANIGSVSMVAVNRKSTAYTHSIKYEFCDLIGYLTADGGISAEEVKMDASSIAFNIPTTFYEQIPNAKAAPCALTCRTYSNETQIGEDQTATFTITAAETLCSPQINGTVEDINPLTLSLTGSKASLIRYVSTALCTITATARNAATIVSKSIGGEIVEGDTRTIQNTSVSAIDFSATDSRGYTNAESVMVDLIPYIPLTCVASGRRTNPTDGNAIISVKGNYFNDTFGAVDNSLKVEYCIDGGNWVEAATNTSGNSYTATANVTGLDYTKSFTVTVKATDAVGSAEQTFIIGKGIPVFDWGENDFTFHVPVNMNADIELKDHNLLKNGVPLSAEDVGALSAIESTDYPGCYYRTTDGATEWFNPPMVAGVEYRTTERYNDKPVYRKLVTYSYSGQMGSSSSNTDFTIPHGISNLSKALRCDTSINNDVTGYYIGSTGGILHAYGFGATNINVRVYKTYFNSPKLSFDLAYIKE